MDRVSQTHSVRLYEDEETILEEVLDFFREKLPQGGMAIAIARSRHCRALEDHFHQTTRTPEVEFIALDAHEMLNSFMLGGRPDPARFEAAVGTRVRDAIASTPAVAVFGEMVAILWERGEPDAAIELERLLNQLFSGPTVHRLCAYSTRTMQDPSMEPKLRAICQQHATIAAPPKLAHLAKAGPVVVPKP